MPVAWLRRFYEDKEKNMKNILSKFKNVKSTGDNQFIALCPAHKDKTPSLSIKLTEKKILLNCFTGCKTEEIVKSVGLKMKDLNYKSVHDSSKSVQQCNQEINGCTFKEYSRSKKVPISFLKKVAKASEIKYLDKKVVSLPYYDDNQELMGNRFRVSLTEKPKFHFKIGSITCLYGLWLQNKKTSKNIFIVEGESDCHTLWFNKFNALGVPGANNWKDERDAIYFEKYKTIYFVREPDGGGDNLFKNLSKSVIANKIKIIELGKYKDTSAMHIASPKKFKKRLKKAMKKALSLHLVLDKETEEKKAELWVNCKNIAESPNILKLFQKDLEKCGVVGETKLVKILYLCLTTRFFSKIVSIIIRGPSSSGKSYIVDTNLKNFFPDSAYIAMTTMSDKALIYDEEDYKHRFLLIYEADGIRGTNQDYIIRSLISEGLIRHKVTITGEDGTHKTQTIEKMGPTGLIITMTKLKYNDENENRCITLTTDDSPEQSRRILVSKASDRDNKVDMTEWIAFQEWLELSEHRVIIPFAPALAMIVDVKGPRVRRDFDKVRALIKCHAMIHQVNREKDKEGRIIATQKDYRIIRSLLNDFMSQSLEHSVSKNIRETVKAVKKLLLEKDINSDFEGITNNELAKELKFDRVTAYRRTLDAENSGYLINVENNEKRTKNYILGDGMPEDKKFLPRWSEFMT